MRSTRLVFASLIAATGLFVAGCSENTGRGAAIGGAAGAGYGLLNGGVVSNTLKGAGVGAAGGFIYDKVKDDD